MKDYQVYLFDFDGTVVDTEESLLCVFQSAFEAVGLTCDRKEVVACMKRSLQETVEVHKIVEQNRIDAFLKALFSKLDSPGSLSLVKLFPDAEKVINNLKNAGKLVGLVTNNSEKHVRLVFNMLGIERCFDVITGNDENTRPKPYPDMIDSTLEKLGWSDKGQVVYVGDAVQDLETAKNADIDGILIDREGLAPGMGITSLLDLLDSSLPRASD